MASSVETAKLTAALNKIASSDPMVQVIAMAAYRHAFSTGIKSEFDRLQSVWPKNSPAWSAEKKRRGWSQDTWKRTGATMKAVSDNPPTKFGTKKGLKTGINKRSLTAFAMPRAFTDGKGKKLNSDRQDEVFSTLRRGSAKARLAKHATAKKKSLKDVLSEAFGPRRDAKTIPARPLIQWSPSWNSTITEHIEKAVAGEITRETGIDAKRT